MSKNQYPVLLNGNVGYLSGTKKVVGPIEKENKVLLEEGYFSEPPIPWEPRIDNGYPNVFYDDEFREYRCYYTSWIHNNASTELTPQERVGITYMVDDHKKYGRAMAGILLATSPDGINWTRPSLGVCEFKGSSDNNILLANAHGSSVFKDSREKDPARRYKMVLRHDAHESMAVSFSADGINWCDPIDWEGTSPAGDTHNFAFWDPKVGRYALITRTWAQGSIRLAARSESDDFITWTEPKEIYRGTGLDDQIYSMPVFRQGDVYFGLGSFFRAGDRASDDFDCVDCELLFSTDGYNWEKAVPGESFIPRSPGKYGDGVPDCSCIYASTPVEIDGKYWFYYFGGNGQHTNFRESSLMRASAHRDMLVGYGPKTPSVPGLIGTSTSYLTGNDLTVVAGLEEGGSIEAAICLPATPHEPLAILAGYHFSESILEELPDNRFRLRFREKNLDELANQPVMIVFRLQNSALYSYGGDITQLEKRI